MYVSTVCVLRVQENLLQVLRVHENTSLGLAREKKNERHQFLPQDARLQPHFPGLCLK